MVWDLVGLDVGATVGIGFGVVGFVTPSLLCSISVRVRARARSRVCVCDCVRVRECTKMLFQMVEIFC